MRAWLPFSRATATRLAAQGPHPAAQLHGVSAMAAQAAQAAA